MPDPLDKLPPEEVIGMLEALEQLKVKASERGEAEGRRAEANQRGSFRFGQAPSVDSFLVCRRPRLCCTGT